MTYDPPFSIAQQFLTDLAALPATDECVDWPWKVNSFGYARLSVHNRSMPATHFVLIQRGLPRPPAPADHALHSCDRPPCVAPWHLRWGSPAENAADKVARRGASRIIGTLNGRAVLTPEQVATIRAEVAAGKSQRSQARAFGLHHSTVQQIIRGDLWASQ